MRYTAAERLLGADRDTRNRQLLLAVKVFQPEQAHGLLRIALYLLVYLIPICMTAGRSDRPRDRAEGVFERLKDPRRVQIFSAFHRFLENIQYCNLCFTLINISLKF